MNWPDNARAGESIKQFIADPLRRAVDTIGATIAAAMEGKRGGTLWRYEP